MGRCVGTGRVLAAGKTGQAKVSKYDSMSLPQLVGRTLYCSIVRSDLHSRKVTARGVEINKSG